MSNKIKRDDISTIPSKTPIRFGHLARGLDGSVKYSVCSLFGFMRLCQDVQPSPRENSYN